MKRFMASRALGFMMLELDMLFISFCLNCPDAERLSIHSIARITANSHEKIAVDKPIEQAKINCAKRLFNNISTSHVRYDAVNDYQQLLNVINSMA